ncbi:AAA family ATPase [Geobacter sp. AOG2]|uniref:AAA family ATPase n=1 Tax=Geobacter sp. AOG2 TaxID=1566347 RepID=UPI001CC53F7B|nr:SMC family ATPase [Geobacter sp. AOG2]GFE59622.1 nuclease SbcCD subunit C [Geobacter sp. AOG2]
MQILSIHLKNIKSHRDTELSFTSGINVLSGPNGVGKSTIFEAIGYALFGVDAKDFVSNVDRFLTIGAKKGEINVVFRTDDDEAWRVSRTVGTGAKWLLAREVCGSFEVEDHARVEETEARIAGLLGLDNGRSLADQFKLVIGPFQNDFLGPFVIKQPTKRQEAFDEILGIDAWRKTYRGTSGLLSAVQERINILAAEVASKQEQLAMLPEKEAEFKTITGEIAVKEQNLKDRDAGLKELEKQLLDLDNREKAIIALSSEIQILENRIKDGEGKIADQKFRIVESEKAQKILDESKAGKEVFEKAEALLIELHRRVQERRVIELEVSNLEKEALRLTQMLGHERTEIGKTSKQLAEEQTKLDQARQELQIDAKFTDLASKLPGLRQEAERLSAQRSLLEGRRESLLEGKDKLAEGVCPFFQEECRNIAGTAPRDVFTSRISDLDRQMKGLEDQIEDQSRRIKEAEAAEKELAVGMIRLQELDKQVLALDERRRKNQERSDGMERLITQQAGATKLADTRRGALQAFAGLDQEIERAENERSQHQASRDAFNANQKDALELANRTQKLKDMEKLLGELKEQLKVKQASLSQQKESYQPDGHREARQEKERLVAETATLRQQIIDMARNVKRLEAEIVQLIRLKENIEAKQAEIKGFVEKEKLVKFLRNQVFKNVSAQLSERFREEISLHADRIYRTIADSDEELYWGENYQITLRDMQDEVVRERSDDQLSGGQMMSAVVALRLALLQTIGARIAFFDEPTSNLDAVRRENLAHAFRAIDVGREELTEHWYDQLFLVSHDIAFTEITDKIIEL